VNLYVKNLYTSSWQRVTGTIIMCHVVFDVKHNNASCYACT